MKPKFNADAWILSAPVRGKWLRSCGGSGVVHFVCDAVLWISCLLSSFAISGFNSCRSCVAFMYMWYICFFRVCVSTCFVKMSDKLFGPFTFTMLSLLFATSCCIQSWHTSICLTFPSPLRDAIPFAVDESVHICNFNFRPISPQNGY